MIIEAASILGLRGNITKETLKKAFRELVKKHHPDFGGDEERMKIINSANDTLLKALENESSLQVKEVDGPTYDERLKDALTWLKKTSLAYEICGMWIWVKRSNETKAYRQKFKDFKFRWANKKKQWYFRPESYKSKNRNSWSMDRIRERYGSERGKGRISEIEAA